MFDNFKSTINQIESKTIKRISLISTGGTSKIILIMKVSCLSGDKVTSN